MFESRRSTNLNRLFLQIGVLVLLLGGPAAGGELADGTWVPIEPGPKVMSDRERAIESDPTRRMQHGVILLEEVSRNDDFGTANEERYHLRAKILSPQGRGLGEVVLPYGRRGTRIKKFWARSIHPDGSVYELKKEDLIEQVERKGELSSKVVRKAVIPRIEPGCVIDYGYVLEFEGRIWFSMIPIQRDWPLREFRYRWIPWRSWPGLHLVTRTEGLDVTVKQGKRSVLVTARNIEPIPSEPLMPPVSEVRSQLYLYYALGATSAVVFWNDLAKKIEDDTKDFGGTLTYRKKLLKKKLKFKEEGSLQENLVRLYDWINLNIRNIGTFTSEEREADLARPVTEDPESIEDVLAQREGYPRQLDRLFAVFARALGAEAFIVLAVDRTERYWKAPLLSDDQFPSWLVAVRQPGEEQAGLTLVDPGSGLPYAQVPWWLTGGMALMATGEGAKAINVPNSRASLNHITAKVDISFADDNEALRADWDVEGTGQFAIKRRWLRFKEPADREEALLELCGASSGFEVLEAKSPGLKERVGNYALRCSGERLIDPIDEQVGTYTVQWTGAWMERVTRLEAGPRRQNVVFPFPRTSTTSLTVHPPSGFTAVTIPMPVAIRSPFGTYFLSFGKINGAYTVDRVFTRSAIWVPPKYYPQLVEFLDGVRKADRTELLFHRVEGDAP